MRINSVFSVLIVNQETQRLALLLERYWAKSNPSEHGWTKVQEDFQ
jgi:hypothetical protein